MTKDTKPEAGLVFQGIKSYPPQQRVDDWGFNAEQQETRVEQFRQLLEHKNAWRKEDHDYYLLLRFLRARNYDLDKAAKMWCDSLVWRKEHGVDTILDDFVFHEREQFLMAYPQGYHRTDKAGRPIYIQLLGKIDIGTLKQITTEERMVKFHIQEYERCAKHIMPICSKLQGRQIDQTLGIMDVKGVGMSHLTGEVKRLMAMLTKYDQDNYPEMLGRICIINAPLVFKALWGLVKPMLNPRTISKIQICQTNYTKDLLEWVDAEHLPEWLGGKSKGTLLDDVGPWSDPDILRRMEREELPLAGRLLKHIQVKAATGSTVEAGGSELGDADGFHSPRSEASFVSFTSTDAGTTPMLAERLLRAHTHRPSLLASAGNDLDSNDGDFQLASSSHANTLGTGPLTTDRTQSLVERIRDLERLHAQQMQRLKGYMPAAAMSPAPIERNAPEGTLLQRLEVLEEGLDLLLRAQELQWQKEEERRGRSRCCGCIIC